MRLGELLVARGQVDPADVERAVKIQQQVGGRLGALLVRVGAISEDLLLKTLEERLDAVYLRNAEELPDSLEVYQFMVASPVRLGWLLDRAVLLWRADGDLQCLARDPQDQELLGTLNYFYPASPWPSTWPPTTRSTAWWISCARNAPSRTCSPAAMRSNCARWPRKPR